MGVWIAAAALFAAWLVCTLVFGKGGFIHILLLAAISTAPRSRKAMRKFMPTAPVVVLVSVERDGHVVRGDHGQVDHPQRTRLGDRGGQLGRRHSTHARWAPSPRGQ